MASEQTPSSPRLCDNCYVFYGRAATAGLCSKCYTESLKEEDETKTQETSFSQSSTGGPTFLNPVVWTFSLEPETISAADNSVVTSASALSVPASSGEGGGDLSATGRCASCDKKLKVLKGFPCKCGNSYCAAHRYPEQHECMYDYKAAGRALLEKKNPVVKSDKLQKLE